MEKVKSNYEKLAEVNVSKYIEQKGGLNYLSWAWAVDQLMRQDPTATWDYQQPVRWGETVMVFCSVTAFGKIVTAQLPVMDHRNKAISNPDAFNVNTAMQRCLAKAIALHGLGLYIYAGEDLPLAERETNDAPISEEQLANLEALVSEVNADSKRFVKFFEIPALKDLPSKRYEEAVKMLEAKRKHKEAA